ncbi:MULTISPECIES: DegT/DnrJ/EryC1/StrS family aminotransferase [Salinibaculum]|uniref:DegT/DnrJ/EryC1/StrS family aminotransferase n=1 Tax=Salinibaculum TaxID=2732368 RepID=UPI0030CBF5AE
MTTFEQQPSVAIADPWVGDEEKAAVERVLDSGQLAHGDEVAAFESEFADYCDCEHGLATANGTAALHAALEGLGIGPGDTVVTTPFTFIATANAVRLVGAEPVFADTDPETYNIDPEAVRARIRAADGDVDAILAVHLYGHPAPLSELAAIADEYDAALVEDCAQAHGARHEGRPVGSVGDVGCFSFYPTKNMTTGEGGMVVTDRDDVHERAGQFVDHGRDGHSGHVRVGHNLRLPDLAAAIGRVQLRRLPEFVEKRRENARRLTEAIEEADIEAPTERSGVRHAYHQYTVRSDRRDELADRLAEFGVDTAVYYPKAVHKEPAYDEFDPEAPVAERAAETVLSLPVHPRLSRRDVDAIVTALGSLTDGF